MAEKTDSAKAVISPAIAGGACVTDSSGDKVYVREDGNGSVYLTLHTDDSGRQRLIVSPGMASGVAEAIGLVLDSPTPARTFTVEEVTSALTRAWMATDTAHVADGVQSVAQRLGIDLAAALPLGAEVPL